METSAKTLPKEIDLTNQEKIPRLFKSRILDAIFSQAHFTVPLFFYLPLIGFFIYRGIWVMEAPVLPSIGLFFAGLFIWTFFEYSLHRWMLHWIPDNRWGKKVNFWVHGIHHYYPKDTRVVPLGRSIPGYALLWVIFYFVCGPIYWHAVFSGFILGYLAYEMVHYASHNSRWQNKWFQKLQKHHMYHHFRNPDSSYGFTGTFWDWIFKTRYEDVGDPEEKPDH